MHTSFKNVLSRTFRQPATASAGCSTVAAWLVPAVAVPAPARPRLHRRHFSRTCQRRAQPPDAHHDLPDAARPAGSPPPKPRVPDRPQTAPVEAWVDCLEPLLPPHLRATTSDSPDTPNIGTESHGTAEDIALFLARTRRHEGVDILSHLAIEQGRWAVVMWLLQTVAGISPPEGEDLMGVPLLATRLWHNITSPIDQTVEQPMALHMEASMQPFDRTLDQLTHQMEPGGDGYAHRNAALGQIWRSLGNMILIAVGHRSQEKGAVLGHVLELLAHLHHAGIIPESVYHYEPPKNKYALQQPPTLYLLSSKILSALSDAAWKAHDPATVSGQDQQPHYTIFGRKIPTSRYQIRTPELGPEVWLELVLWSCLHGSWLDDGVAILKKLASYKDESRWSVFHSSQVLNDNSDSSFETMTWTDLLSFSTARGTQADSPERFVVDKTISSEVVAAYIDGVLNRIMVGVDEHHDPLQGIFADIATFKDLLDRDNLGLGTATWDSVMTRFIESGGIDPNFEAHWLMELLRFSSKFEQELDYHNAPREYEDSPGSPSYILDPSSLSLGVLHQALRINITNGNLTAAVEVIAQLQHVTDQNKERSMQKFFSTFHEPSKDSAAPKTLSSNVHPKDYPIYFPQIPPTLLAGVLNLATQTQAYDVAERLLYSNDVDGPLIPPELYGHTDVTAAIARYAVTVDDTDLIARVRVRPPRKGFKVPETSWIMLEIQVEQQRWDAIKELLHNLAVYNRETRVANISAIVAKQLLILQNISLKRGEKMNQEHPLAKAASIFRMLIQLRVNPRDTMRFYRFHGILCVLSSVGPAWRKFCSRLLFYHEVKSLDDCVREEDFAQLLEGVVETQGAYSGMKMMAQWCEEVTMAHSLEKRYYLKHGDRYIPWAKKIDEITVEGEDGSELVLRGQRVSLTLPLMRTVYRAALKQIEEDPEAAWKKSSETREVLDWALTGLRTLGLSTREIGYELNGITRGYQIGLQGKKYYRAKKRVSKRKGQVERRAERKAARALARAEAANNDSLEEGKAQDAEREKKDQ